MTSYPPFAALIGIDWADKAHAVCLKIPGKDEVEHLKLAHQPEAIDDWAQALRARFSGQPVAVALEQSKGPLLYALCKYDFLVLFPVHPQTAANYRQTWAPSRAKDDPSDAKLLVELLERHRDRLTAWKPQSQNMRLLCQLVEMRRTLIQDKVRLTNRLTAALKNYYPQALELFEDKDTLIFCDFLEKWPTLQNARQARRDVLERFFKDHNAHYDGVNRKRVETIKTATALTDDLAILTPNSLMVEALIPQLKNLLLSINAFEDKIESLFDHHPDAKLFKSLPGAASIFAPRLLTAFGEDRDRYQSADDLLAYAGIAPVIERSGQKAWTHWRYTCPAFLRQTFVEWTNQSIRFSFWARAYYQTQKDRGKSHQVAIRALAFKWIRILFRCWKNRTPYDESKYLMALQQKGSPLLQSIAKT
jgi:transposase